MNKLKTREFKLESLIDKRLHKEVEPLLYEIKKPLIDPILLGRLWKLFLEYGASGAMLLIPIVEPKAKIGVWMLKFLKVYISWKAKRAGVDQKEIKIKNE